LWDDRYAVRDKKGNWLGQGVAFSIDPKGVLENRCGERLWRVTATVQGDGLRPLEPGTSLMLLKRNVFASQYCRGRSQDGALQYNSIRPSNQLFRGVIDSTGDETMDHTGAILYPWFNVRRFDFYNSEYRKGASEELAGRGVYGDYVILFPKQVLEGSRRFPLENVEDILLRIDYLSVDNQPVISAAGQ
jgi:hypothetical protein